MRRKTQKEKGWGTVPKLCRLLGAAGLIFATGINAHGQNTFERTCNDLGNTSKLGAVTLSENFSPEYPDLPAFGESAFTAEEVTPVAEAPTWLAAIFATVFLLLNV